MWRPIECLSVAAVITLASGCFQSTTKVTLRSNGSVKTTQTFSANRSLLDFMSTVSQFDPRTSAEIQSLKAALTGYGDTDRLRLKEAGVKMKKHVAIATGREFEFEWSASISHIDDAHNLASLTGSDDLAFGLVHNEDGTSTLRWTVLHAPQPDPTTKLSDEDTKAVQDAMIRAVITHPPMSVHAEFSVPGEVIGFRPKAGGTSEGSTVVWDINNDNISTAADDPMFGGSFEVTYRTP